MTGDAASILVLDGVRKSFGSVVAVDTVDLSVARGEFFALLGPSGCGKTTLMRLVAGFETADAGRIMIDGVDVTRVPPYRRPVNMMFQSYALFPHMSVERNIAFGLVQERMPRRDIRARVDEMLHLVQLEGYGKRRPSQLSGGQKQRVALARALAKKPKLLLLDEPLAALDRKLREETQFELMRVQRELGLGFVVVTHDQDEAMIMAQRIAVMRAGRFEQVAPPRDVYDRPAARWVADFIGEINLFDGTVVSVDSALAVVEEDSGARLSVVVESAWTPGDRVTVAVRPERMRLAAGEASPINAMSGRLVETAFRGDTTHWRIARPNGAILRMSQPNMADPSGLVRGDAVVASFAPDAARVLSR